MRKGFLLSSSTAIALAALVTTATAQTDTQPQSSRAQSADRNPADSQESSRPNAGQPQSSSSQAHQPKGTDQAKETGQPQQTNRPTQQSEQKQPSNQQAQQPSQSQPNQQAQQPAGDTSQQAQRDQNNVSVSLNDQQRTSISQVIAREKVTPVTNINFSVAIGTVVPQSVRLAVVPPQIVSIVPQYRGYSYFVTRDQIVIVDPSTYRIATVLPYSGGGSKSSGGGQMTTAQSSGGQATTAQSNRSQGAAATASGGQATSAGQQRGAARLSNAHREIIRKQISQASPQRTVTRTRKLTIGEDVPDTVELQEFPETVYRDAPDVRSYRYFRSDRNVIVVDPGPRRVIDVID
jgi:hypothetical protein